jgi:hypothetical protein
MSTSGITGSLYGFNAETEVQQFQKEFQQLGQDLSSGNLSAAQSDFVTLQSDAPQLSTNSATQSTNLTAAQQDYSTLQQDFQSQTAQVHHHHHRHHSGESQQSQFSQLFDQLGEALQSNNLSGAQQAYSSLQKLFQSDNQSSTSGASSQSTSGGLSVSA